MDENQKVYNAQQLVNWYTNLQGLVPVEKVVFNKYDALVQNSDFLDIGIGGGRTTKALLKRCKTYTGIDYSDRFISAVKANYPAATCLVMDARDLSAFADKRFDMVNFSFNGIDYVDLAGRIKILSEIKRVLKPNGIFFFSTHNKNHPEFNTNPWLSKNNSFFINIKTFIKLLPFSLKKIKQNRNQIFTKDYAIINDSAHNYSLMTFYTTTTFLRKQLAEAGFCDITFFTKEGKQKEDAQLEEWIFVTAKKTSA